VADDEMGPKTFQKAVARFERDGLSSLAALRKAWELHPDLFATYQSAAEGEELASNILCPLDRIPVLGI
jgi:hypothetical protein